jgi:hypothetical protein
MPGADQSDKPDFYEWMVTNALGLYLKPLAADKQIEWFGKLEAKSGANVGPLGMMFPTLWPTEEVSGAPEKPFRVNHAEDRGAISEDEYRSTFQSITPDFRYWTERRDRQLILEAKGTDNRSSKNDDQARRYFDYLRKWPSTGIVIYLVHSNRDAWHDWLQGIAAENASKSGATEVGFAVAELDDKAPAPIARQLIRVISQSLVKAASLLDRASKLGI